jgi:hypothetical protein
MAHNGTPSPHGGSAALPPRQFLGRALAVVSGLTLLLIVDVHGLVFYLAWSLIVLALASEGAATLLYWRRDRRVE